MNYSKNEINEYLNNLYELEKSVYVLEKRIEVIEKDCFDMKKGYNYSKSGTSSGIWTLVGVAVLFFSVVRIFNFSSFTEILVMLIVGVVSFFVFIYGFLSYVDYSDRKKRAIARYEQLKKEYGVDENKLESLLPKMKNRLYKRKNLLEKYYQKNIIYPKYRGLVPVSSLYEYFKSGTCSSLASAYNKYDIESTKKGFKKVLDDYNSADASMQYQLSLVFKEVVKRMSFSDLRRWIANLEIDEIIKYQ